MSEKITLKLNGQQVEAPRIAGQLLVDLLRDELGLTGTKEACGVGVCGLCTVLVDGHPASACLTLADTVGGQEVWTVEGLSRAPGEDGALMRAVQEAFVACEGMQCGICTSGQVVSAFSLLKENPKPGEEEIRHYMAGNLCRCTGYGSIMRSVQQASERWGESHAAL